MIKANATLDPDRLFAPILGAQKLGLAVSGGVDSLGLMLLAHTWAAEHDVQLQVYTVDHGLRPQSSDECRFVSECAGLLGLPARILLWEGEKPDRHIQASARAARYRLMAEAMAGDGVGVLATAHHIEDQAETVLMRLAHGSGLDGLRGIKHLSVRHGITLFRPLLGVDKQQLAALVAEAGWAPVQDPSNHQPGFERVRWRQQIRALAPLGLDARRLAEFARRTARADEALDHYAQKALEDLATLSPLGVVRLERRKLADLPAEVGLRLVRRSLTWVGAGTKPYALASVEALFAELVGAEAISGRTLCGALVRADEHEVIMAREDRHLPVDATVVEGGAVVEWDGRFSIENRNPDWPIKIASGSGVTRAMAESVLARRIEDPADALKTAPVVWRGDGEIMALGAFEISNEVRVSPSGWGRELRRNRP